MDGSETQPQSKMQQRKGVLLFSCEWRVDEANADGQWIDFRDGGRVLLTVNGCDKVTDLKTTEISSEGEEMV